MTKKDVRTIVKNALRLRYGRRKPKDFCRYAVVVANSDIFAVEHHVDEPNVDWVNHVWTFPLWEGSMPVEAWRSLLKQVPELVASAWDEAHGWDKEACCSASYKIEKLAASLYHEHIS